MPKQIILTDHGLKQLEEELEYLKTIRRAEIAEKIKEARSFGDLSENSEYDDAKNEQAVTESRIQEIENMLKNATVLDMEHLKKDKVNVGSTVKVMDLNYNEEMLFTVVSSTEANPMSGKISDESPIGKGLLGHKKGEVINVETPSGPMSFKILSIDLIKE